MKIICNVRRDVFGAAFCAKKGIIMLNNQYFAPTMWVHFSWRLQYKFIISHNHVYNFAQSGKGKISSKAS